MNRRYDYLYFLMEQVKIAPPKIKNKMSPSARNKLCRKAIKDDERMKEYFEIAARCLSWAESSGFSGMTQGAYERNCGVNLNKVTPEEIYCAVRFLQCKDKLPLELPHDLLLDLFSKSGYNKNGTYFRWLSTLGRFLIKADSNGKKQLLRDQEKIDEVYRCFTEETAVSDYLQVDGIVRLHVNSVFDDLKKFFVKRNTPEEQVVFFFMDKKNRTAFREVRPIQCYFFYFYVFSLRGDNLISATDEKTPGAQRRGIFSDIFMSAGLDSGFTLLPYLRDAITYSSVEKGHPVEIWKERLQEEIPDRRLHIERFEGEISYDEWQESIIGPGLDILEDEATDETHMTIYQIRDWQQTSSDLSEEMKQAILDTDTRRHWYFCRILQKIMNKQISMENDNPKEFSSVRLAHGKRIYFHWISNGCIIPERINTTINHVFDCTDEGQALARFPGRAYFRSEELGIVGNPEGGLRPGVKGVTELIRFDARGGNREERKITRSLLLLMVLLAKAYGVEDMDEKYLKEHILENSRFEPMFNINNRIDAYFLDTYEGLDKRADKSFRSRVNYLRKQTGDMELDYLMNGTAILQLIFLCKA